MTKHRIPYTYCVLRYVHDPAAGEALNVGVLAYAPSEHWVARQIEQRYARLSATFRGFNGHQYRAASRRTLSAVEALRARWRDALPSIDHTPHTVDSVFRLRAPRTA